MVGSHTRPQQDLHNGLTNGLQSGKDSISQAEWKKQTPPGAAQRLRGQGGSRPQPTEVWGGFPPTLAPLPRLPWLSLPARASHYSQAGGWVGTGLCQAPLHPKRLSLPTTAPFPRREPSPSHLHGRAAALIPSGQTHHAVQAMCSACPFPQASTGIQRKPCSIVHLQHLHSEPPAPHSSPHPFSSHKYSSGYTPLAFGGGVSLPPLALVPAAKGLKRVLLPWDQPHPNTQIRGKNHFGKTGRNAWLQSFFPNLPSQFVEVKTTKKR